MVKTDYPLPEVVKLPPMPLDIRIQEEGARKLIYAKEPILFIWISSLGVDQTVELIWTWLQDKTKYRAYFHFLVPLVPLTKEFEESRGIKDGVIDPLEISRVEEWHE